MSKLLAIMLGLTVIYTPDSNYSGGTLAPVILAGSVIKHSGTEIINKYPRKDCPVCKGKGWYLSGDGIEKVPCGYCIPDKSEVKDSIKCANPDCTCTNCDCVNCGCVPSVKQNKYEKK